MSAAIEDVDTGLPAVPAHLQPLTSQEERLQAGPLILTDPGTARDADFLTADWSG